MPHESINSPYAVTLHGKTWVLYREVWPAGFCQCGCGEPTAIAPRNRLDRRWRKGEPLAFLPSHSQKGRFGPPFEIADAGFTSPCWLWRWSLGSFGYPQIVLAGEHLQCARLFYESRYGTIPKGRDVRHVCGHNACVNPEHLEAQPEITYLGLLCGCGCGRPTSIAADTYPKLGVLKGQQLPFLHGHSKRRSGPEYVVDQGGCWIWQKGIDKRSGYGRVGNVPAHRVIYERLVGPIPEGLSIDHLCRKRLCVNPAHLEPVTPAENSRRGLAGHGTALSLRKLSDEQVLTIRAGGHTDVHFAALFAVSKQTIRDVRRRVSYREVGE